MKLRRKVWVALVALCFVYVFGIRYFLNTSPEKLNITVLPEGAGVNLIYQIPVFLDQSTSNKQRTKEYVNTLITNLCNPDVASVNILTERATDEKAIRGLLQEINLERFSTQVSHSYTTALYQPYWVTYEIFRGSLYKLTFKNINRWLMYSDAFEYANTFLNNRICTVQNADISLTHGFHNLSKDLFRPPYQPSTPDFVGRVYALSRHEAPTSTCPHSREETCGQPTIRGSYDSFVFLSPIPQAVVDQVPFVQNIMGAESRVIWAFKCAGYSVTNPCSDLITLHRHCESKRVRSEHDGREPFVKYDMNGPYAWPIREKAPNLQYVAPEKPKAEFCLAKVEVKQ